MRNIKITKINRLRLIILLIVLTTTIVVATFNRIKPYEKNIVETPYVIVERLNYSGRTNKTYYDLRLYAGHLYDNGNSTIIYNDKDFLISLYGRGGQLAPFLRVKYCIAFDLYKNGKLEETKNVVFTFVEERNNNHCVDIFDSSYGIGDYTLRYSGTISGPAKVTIDGEKYFSIVGEAVNKWE